MGLNLPLLPLSHHELVNIGIKLAVGMLLIGLMRWIYGLWTKMDSKHELASNDNFALGISIAGSILSLSILISGVVAMTNLNEYGDLVIRLLAYGTIGMLLIMLGRIAHDRLILDELNKNQQILAHNSSVALVDAASSVATAIIVRSVLIWVDGFNLDAIIAVFSGFVVAMTMLLTTTRLIERHFARHNQNASMQSILCQGQIALAIQHSGHIIGMALAVTATTHIVEYTPHAYVSNMLSWLMVALILTLTNVLLTFAAKRIVLQDIDLVREVDHQHNIGIASIEMVLSLGIGLLLLGAVSF
ncbi:DUF350 domain-containing protein [Neptunicella sp. SCSIO 80796]|uniref:DUF350 domain-containing protein n=1 Tax=Neptunicella plasticusilytica TaxID=3117012 RepID=UPI003A4D36D3